MKIWLYYANVGGGHKGVALALAREFKKIKKEKAEITFVDIAEGSNKLVKYFFEEGYSFLVNKTPWLYKLLYQVSTFKIVMWLEILFSTATTKRFIKKLLLNDKPDVIVATYFLVQPIIAALRELGLTIPVQVVVTDPFTSHPIWFYNKALTYFIGSEQIHQYALAQGVVSNKIHLVAPIVNSLPVENIDREKLKSELGLNSKKKAVLVVGGGNGLFGGPEILESLLKSDWEAEFLVVCGSNCGFKNGAEKLAKIYNNKRVVKVFGLIDFLPNLIAVSDVVVGKAGAGLVMETVWQKKPMVIAHYIWGQEEGNKDFVVDNHFGFYEPDIANLPKLVYGLLFNQQEIECVVAAHSKLVVKDGAKMISREVCELAK